MLRRVLPLAAVLAFAAPGAHATRPPGDCGPISSNGKRYTIKEDGVRCVDARAASARWLKTRQAPRGWRCRAFPDQPGRVRFYCNAGKRVFFGVRR